MNKLLRTAAYTGDIVWLRQHLPTANIEQKMGALRRAVDGGQFFAVSELLRSHVPILTSTFLTAVRLKHGRIVHAFLGFGADVDSTTEDNGESALMVAIRMNDKAMVAVLLDHDADVNVQDTKCRTALLHAVTKHQWALAEQLVEKGAKATAWSHRLIHETIQANNADALRTVLKAGANPNDVQLKCPLIVLAAKAGQIEIVRVLIEAGADVNLRIIQSRTALMWAAQQGNEEMVQMLIKAGANVNAALKTGQTAIRWATDGNHGKVVDLLVEAGAKVGIQRKGNRNEVTDLGKRKVRPARNLRNPLTTAISANYYRNVDECYFPIIAKSTVTLKLWRQIDNMLLNSDFSQVEPLHKILMEKLGNVNAGDGNRRTVLMFACAFGLHEVTKILLSFGASVLTRDRQGIDVLMWAAKGGNPNTVELLLKKGAKLYNADKQSRTCLHHAMRCLDLQIITNIMKAGGRLQSASQLGGALVWAAKEGHAFIVKELLSVFVNPNVVDESGRTPLIWASVTGHIDCVWWLLRAQANPNIADRYRKRALFYALENGHFQVFTALVSSYADTSRIEGDYSALHVATRLQQLEFVRLLLKYRGLQKQDVGRDGMTPLMHGCRNDCRDIVHLLLEYGSPPNRVNSCGDTALHFASRADAAKCIELLVKNGADVEARRAGGRTPLLEAAQLGNVASVFALLTGRANVEARDDQGKSALDLALSETGQMTEESARVVQILISWGASSPRWKEIDRMACEVLGGDSHENRVGTSRKRKRVSFGGVDYIRRNKRKVFV